MRKPLTISFLLLWVFTTISVRAEKTNSAFFEKQIRPILVRHCYDCHSEEAMERQGGLLLDRESGWLKGGDTQKAIVPGDLDASLLIKAVRYTDENLQMPPDNPLTKEQVQLLERWVRTGAPGPKQGPGESDFSRLGDQEYLFAQAKNHWAFQPVSANQPPKAEDPQWNQHAIDRFVFAELKKHNLTPSPRADSRTLLRRLTYDLTGLPPTSQAVDREAKEALPHSERVDLLLESPAFGEHIARMWLDVARYADTDSFYRPDTRTPHYFPFAFPYRDYVIQSFNEDKPFDQFVREQLAADLMTTENDAPELAALGFLTVGPYANRNQTERLDDWIDVTTRGLMGVTVACARCHDHKYEPIPTTDYYALRGVFESIVRIHPLDEKNQPTLSSYEISKVDREDYRKKRAAIDAKLKAATGKKSKNNNRSIVQKIRETELAELLSFHPGAPVHMMVVKDRGKPIEPFVFLRGERSRRGEPVSRRFLTILDPAHAAFSKKNSGRLELAQKITDPTNPLTARVFVNRVWGFLMGSHLVETPSDFGLQGAAPTHPELLDWLVQDFIDHGWSVKHLVRRIVLSRTYQQSSRERDQMVTIDPENRRLWRANRKHLSIEALRDSLLAVSGRLDRKFHGRPAPLWGKDATHRRAIYGYINRFNLDPTLRTFGFPTPMQTQPNRRESIVAPQALFTMNSPFVIEQAAALTETETFVGRSTNEERVRSLFNLVFQRDPSSLEIERIERFVEIQKNQAGNKSPWPLVAQSLLMSNEFQYID